MAEEKVALGVEKAPEVFEPARIQNTIQSMTSSDLAFIHSESAKVDTALCKFNHGQNSVYSSIFVQIGDRRRSRSAWKRLRRSSNLPTRIGSPPQRTSVESYHTIQALHVSVIREIHTHWRTSDLPAPPPPLNLPGSVVLSSLGSGRGDRKETPATSRVVGRCGPKGSSPVARPSQKRWSGPSRPPCSLESGSPLGGIRGFRCLNISLPQYFVASIFRDCLTKFAPHRP